MKAWSLLAAWLITACGGDATPARSDAGSDAARDAEEHGDALPNDLGCSDGQVRRCTGGRIQRCLGGAFGECIAAEICDGIDNDSDPNTADGLDDPALHRLCILDDCVRGEAVCHGGAIECSAAPRRCRVSPRAPPGGDGQSWDQAFGTIQSAVDSDCSELWLAAGTYVPGTRRVDTFRMPPTVRLLGGFAGNELSAEARAPSRHVAILSGDVDDDDAGGPPNAGNALRLMVGQQCTLLDGLTLTGAYNDGRSFASDNFGVFYQGGGAAHLRRVHIRGNWAHASGGHVGFEDADVTVSDSVLADNVSIGEATVFGSGAVSAFGGSFRAERTVFRGNGGPGLNGGGVRLRAVRASFLECSFDGNQSRNGGALSAHRGTVSIRSSTFSGNRAIEEGGGLHLVGCPLQLADSTLAGNRSDIGGAVVISGERPHSVIAGSLLVGNEAVRGPAIVVETQDSHLTLSGSVISGNRATGPNGPVIDLWTGARIPAEPDDEVPQQLALHNVTAFGNGPGPLLWGSARARFAVYNSIVWSGTEAPIAWFDLTEGGRGWAQASIIQGFGGEIPGVSVLSAEPSFEDPDGPDDVLGTADDRPALLPGSQGVDAGDNDAVGADLADLDGDDDRAEPSPFDVVGRERRQDHPGTPDTGRGPAPVVDMGAYELGE